MTFGIQSDLAITICDDPADATVQGFHYRRPDYLPIEIVRAVVVKKGTVEGNATVDLVLVDEKGQHYVVLIKGSLLKTLGGAL